MLMRVGLGGACLFLNARNMPLVQNGLKISFIGVLLNRRTCTRRVSVFYDCVSYTVATSTAYKR